MKKNEGRVPNVSDGPQPGDIVSRDSAVSARASSEHLSSILNETFLTCDAKQIIPIDTSQLDDIIDNFNALPKPYKSPSGMFDNHWSFDVR